MLVFYVGFSALRTMMTGPAQSRDIGVRPQPGAADGAAQKAEATNNPLAGFVPDAVLNPYGDDITKFSKSGPPHSVAWPFGSEVDFDVILTEQEVRAQCLPGAKRRPTYFQFFLARRRTSTFPRGGGA